MIHIIVWAIKAMIIFIKLGAFGIDIAPFLSVLGDLLSNDNSGEVIPEENE
ncbi:MAG: hypothetical protein MJ177_00895 [Clostridia bacterium]|nr:hypothetical protein [Clostridia bacterium]